MKFKVDKLTKPVAFKNNNGYSVAYVQVIAETEVGEVPVMRIGIGQWPDGNMFMFSASINLNGGDIEAQLKGVEFLNTSCDSILSEAKRICTDVPAVSDTPQNSEIP